MAQRHATVVINIFVFLSITVAAILATVTSRHHHHHVLLNLK